MRVDEAAGQAGLLEELPLARDFAAHEFAGSAGEADAPAGADGGISPGPFFDGGGNGIGEVKMPADGEGGMGAGERDGVGGAGLGHHERGAGEDAGGVGEKNRLIDGDAHPQVVRDKNYLLGHNLWLVSLPFFPCPRKFSLPAPQGSSDGA